MPELFAVVGTVFKTLLYLVLEFKISLSNVHLTCIDIFSLSSQVPKFCRR